MKAATIYRAKVPASFTSSDLEEKLQAAVFAPCGATQEKSIGWVPPRNIEHSALVEVVGGIWVLRLQFEMKSVPAQAVKDLVAKQVKDIEQQTGRKPGKKEVRELKEEAVLTLLPHAFPKRSAVNIWIDPTRSRLTIDSTTSSKSDAVATELVRAIDGLELSLVQTALSPQAAMALWLAQRDAPGNLTIERECELRAADESKAVVKYSKHSLDIEEVIGHIAQGKVPQSLALTWNDRVSFTLDASLHLKKIKFLDVVFEGGGGETQDDPFDTDMAIATAEVSQLTDDMIAALGEEVAA